MNIPDRPDHNDVQSQRENRALASLLFIGVFGSACIHAAVINAPVPTLWRPPVQASDDTMEVVVDPTRAPDDKVSEITKEPEPVAKTEEPQINETPAIALAPETTILKEGKDAAAPDNLKPLLTKGNSDSQIQQGGGSVIAKDGIGSGFGNAKIPSGFIFGGKINGSPNGKKDGVVGGNINGKSNANANQNNVLPTVPTPPADTRAPKLECLSCPKPQFRGKEGTPRVTYDIAPDGRVINVRLRQTSGDEQTDRETIEAMSKWQFDPKTVPEGGRTNVKVRVTFEEEGSQFQRQNEERRRRESELAAQESEQRRLAEQARQQRDAASSKSPAPTTETLVTPPSAMSESVPTKPVPAAATVDSAPVTPPVTAPVTAPTATDPLPPPPPPPLAEPVAPAVSEPTTKSK